MKSLYLSIILLAGASALSASTAAFLVSPFLSKSDLKKVETEIQTFVLSEADPGSVILILDGWSGQEVAEITIPDLRIDSPTARIRTVGKSLGLAHRWFEKERSIASKATGGDLNLPELLDVLERKKPDSVVVIGSPIYRDSLDPKLNWYQDGGENSGYWIPTDGSFFVKKGMSPWAVNQARSRLSGASVHWWMLGNLSFPSDIYLEQSKRFYALYFSLEGGKLVSFMRDGGHVMEGAFRTDLAPYTYRYDPEQEGAAMRRAEVEIEYDDKSYDGAEEEIPLDLGVKPISRVLLIDITSSMGAIFPAVAQQVSMMPDGENSLLITYSDHSEPRVVTVYAESEDPSTIARALRSIQLADGKDTPEALGDGLNQVRRELSARKVEGVIEILIWTDAPPKSARKAESGIDYRHEFNELLAAGHQITVFQCAKDQEFEWVPSGVTVIRNLF